MKRHRVSAGILIALVATASSGAANATSFVVRPGGENKVAFVSKAANESFEGKTNRLEGTINVDPTKVGDSASVHFEVDLASLDTGIGMRNRHMRENHLETAKYPKAIFEGAMIRGPSDAALNAGKAVPLDVEGTFTLHGVSRRIRIMVQTTYQPNDGGRIAFQTRFPVLLADYAISRPQFLFLKLAETQEVRVSGVARAAR